jgi:hypothetical protein
MSDMHAGQFCGPAIEVARMRLLLALLSQARMHLLAAVDDCQDDEHSDRPSLSAAALLTTWTIDVLNGCVAQFEQVISILDASGGDSVEESLPAAAAVLDPASVVDWAMPQPPAALTCRHSLLTDVPLMFEEAEQTAARLPFETVSRPIRVLHDWSI